MVVRYPGLGRVATAQASVAMGLPLCWLLLRVLPGLPDPQAAYWSFAATFAIMGVLITWCGFQCRICVSASADRCVMTLDGAPWKPAASGSLHAIVQVSEGSSNAYHSAGAVRPMPPSWQT